MSGTAGGHMARQQAGIQKFNDGVAAQKKLQDKLFLENMAAVAGTMAATDAYLRHKAQVKAYNVQLWNSCTPEQRTVLEQYWARERARVRRNWLAVLGCAAAIAGTFCSDLVIGVWPFFAACMATAPGNGS